MKLNRQQILLVAITAWVGLIIISLGWELWWAPLRPGGSWLALKAVFLLAPLFGILRGKRYTYKWLLLFIQFYLLEGLTRATSDSGLSRGLAITETVLAAVLFVASILYVRATRPVRPERTVQPG